eukprot:3343446-Prymnesium_polylepis.1
MIEVAFHSTVGTGLGRHAECSRAAQQARLPVRMGGCGLTSQASISGAACVGSWALVWRPMRRLAPQLFAGIHRDLHVGAPGAVRAAACACGPARGPLAHGGHVR